MLFNTLPFLIFFPIVTAAYYLLPYRMRWVWLLAASCFFYMYFKPIYILILLATILIDYSAARLMERFDANERKRKTCLTASVVATLAVLFIFKYQGLFRETNIILPIGLSFHTFQSLSYVIEVYRRTQKAEHHFGLYSLYVMFYPQLVTGPIERPNNLLRQLRIDQPFRLENLSSGVMLILFGLFTKMAVADNLATYVDAIYASPDRYGSVAIALGLALYSFQIYCDFFGYSTIAIGCARAMGYDLMDNFRAPYLSTSIGEFWHRWHISLSSWFRDYLYIPLGGSRVRVSRWAFNILVVFLLSGLWHGASWTFVAWGGLHGLLLIIEGLPAKLRKRKAPGKEASFFTRIVRRTIVFVMVTLLWSLFRAETFGQWQAVLARLFSCSAQGESLCVGTKVWLLLGTFMATDLMLRGKRIDHWCQDKPKMVRWSIAFALAFCTIAFASVEAFPFIYFQF